MSRRLVALTWSPTDLRVLVASWRSGRLEDVAVERIGTTDPGAAAWTVPAAATVAVMLPPTEAGRRTLELPFRQRRAIDDVVPLETCNSLPGDVGPLRVVWEQLADPRTGTTRVLATFAREATLRALQDGLAGRDATVARIDAAPMPIWGLVDEAHDTAVLAIDAGGAWIACAAADGRPLHGRRLHADAGDPSAVAAEVVASLAAWGAAPARMLVAGAAITPAHRRAVSEATGIGCGSLEHPALTNDDLAAEPLLTGALLVLARRADLPLALAVPKRVPRARRRRLAALAVAAGLLLVVHGALGRHHLARRAVALEAAVDAVAALVVPPGPAPPSYERLEAAAAALPMAPSVAPAIVRLSEIAAHLPAGLPLDLGQLRLDPEHVHLGGDLPTFDAVETMRRALATSPRLGNVTIAEMRARVDGAGVEFVLDARWLRSGERAS